MFDEDFNEDDLFLDYLTHEDIGRYYCEVLDQERNCATIVEMMDRFVKQNCIQKKGTEAWIIAVYDEEPRNAVPVFDKEKK